MENNVNLQKVENYAKALYLSGYSCSESLVATLINQFELDVDPVVIKMATGFSGGIGKTGHICGALTGGIMALGILFGRDHSSSSPVADHSFGRELLDFFKDNNPYDTVDCQKLTTGYDLAINEHKLHCSHYVGAVAKKAATMIIERNA